MLLQSNGRQPRKLHLRRWGSGRRWRFSATTGGSKSEDENEGRALHRPWLIVDRSGGDLIPSSSPRGAIPSSYSPRLADEGARSRLRAPQRRDVFAPAMAALELGFFAIPVLDL